MTVAILNSVYFTQFFLIFTISSIFLIFFWVRTGLKKGMYGGPLGSDPFPQPFQQSCYKIEQVEAYVVLH